LQHPVRNLWPHPWSAVSVHRMKRSTVLVILVLLVGTIELLPARASTPVAGPITSDTTWTAANSPYTLTGDVTVQGGATLTIEPGVEVNGFGRLIVLTAQGANLRAQGSASAPIAFGTSGAFGGLVFNNSAAATPYVEATNSALDHVQISNAGVGLDLQAASVPISNAAFTNNDRGIAFNIDSLVVTGSTFTNNTGHAIRGMARGEVHFSYNAFWNNQVSVEILASRTCSCSTARWDLHDNDFLRGPASGRYDVTVNGDTATTSDIYDATDNWWETADGPEIQARIFDGVDDGLEKVVAWDPPSTTSNTTFVEPEPSLTPTPTASPTPSSRPASRAISLRMHKHLVATGKVSSDRVDCMSGEVRLQRRKSGRWKIVGRTLTASDGSYRKQLPDRTGRYRTVVLPSTECLRAISAVRRHGH
jgi:hypothetical protein